MTGLILTGVSILIIVLVSLIGIPILQQRRLLRTRAHFGGRLLVAQDRERAAIARELHDDVVQRLIALTMGLRRSPVDPKNSIAEQFDVVINDLRAMARGLHPSAAEHAGLSAALHDLGHAFEERQNFRVQWLADLNPDELPPTERLALYRVAQEALNNASRHAGVDEVTMSLEAIAGTIQLSIRDEGKGFDRSKASVGLGLTSMEERLSLLGGSFRIESAPGRGTEVIARVPARKREK